MNELAVLHIPDSQYCFAIAPNEIVIRLRLAKEDEDAEVSLIFSSKYRFPQSKKK